LETCIAPTIAASILPERIIAKLVAESKKLAPLRAVTVSLAGANSAHLARAVVFTTQFDTYDSRGAEARWSILETRFPVRSRQHRSQRGPRERDVRPAM
jgi:hypothetical protein